MGGIGQEAARSFRRFSPLEAYRIGRDVTDLDGFTTAFGIAPSGATLIRPDGFVTWRSASAVADPATTLIDVLSAILMRP